MLGKILIRIIVVVFTFSSIIGTVGCSKNTLNESLETMQNQDENGNSDIEDITADGINSGEVNKEEGNTEEQQLEKVPLTNVRFLNK